MTAVLVARLNRWARPHANRKAVVQPNPLPAMPPVLTSRLAVIIELLVVAVHAPQPFTRNLEKCGAETRLVDTWQHLNSLLQNIPNPGSIPYLLAKQSVNPPLDFPAHLGSNLPQLKALEWWVARTGLRGPIHTRSNACGQVLMAFVYRNEDEQQPRRQHYLPKLTTNPRPPNRPETLAAKSVPSIPLIRN